MDPVLFFDPASPAPYSARTLSEEGLGGTEASVVRLAEALDAIVVQPNRTTPLGRYRPAAGMEAPRAVVVVRDPAALVDLAGRFPTARLHLWLHDRMRPGSRRAGRLRAALGRLGDRDLTLIAVSEWQRRDIAASVAALPNPNRFRIRTIWNPIDDDLVPDRTPIDRNRLIFCSAPSKGLWLAIDAVRWLRRSWPELTLEVAHPSYQRPRELPIDGVRWLGSLPHRRLLERVRSALAVFAPNFSVAETFGLVLAEANAVGTPVLTHRFGAAPEVVADPGQLLEVGGGRRAYEAIARALPLEWRGATARLAGAAGLFSDYRARLEAWRDGDRPRPTANPGFRTTAVAAAWRDLLEGDGA